MLEKIRHIESLYRTQRIALDLWYYQALEAEYKKNSVSAPQIPSSLKEIKGMDFRREQDKLKELHDYLIKGIIVQSTNDYTEFFCPHLEKDSISFTRIKCKKIFHAFWVIFILREIGVIFFDEALLRIFPLHFSNKNGGDLNLDSLESNLTKIRRAYEAKTIPAYVKDILLIFPTKCLPNSLL